MALPCPKTAKCKLIQTEERNGCSSYCSDQLLTMASNSHCRNCEIEHKIGRILNRYKHLSQLDTGLFCAAVLVAEPAVVIVVVVALLLRLLLLLLPLRLLLLQCCCCCSFCTCCPHAVLVIVVKAAAAARAASCCCSLSLSRHCWLLKHTQTAVPSVFLFGTSSRTAKMNAEYLSGNKNNIV